MKKLINAVDAVVSDTLKGVEAADCRVKVDHELKVVYRRNPRPGKVGLVSGGGSGHEPLHAGYVGHGMLDAAACGEMFTSPTPEQVLRATELADQGAGVLHIVKNYTGDVMNFEMAAEMTDDIEVRSVVVADDVAVKDSLYTAGRRGVGLTVLVEKIVGAQAEAGGDLAACEAVAKKICERGRTMGMALTSCTVPAVGHPTFDLPADQMEIGIGIHGEPGRERLEVESAHQIAQRLLDPILQDYDFTSEPVIVLMNGMGGTPLSELYLMYAQVKEILTQKGIEVARVLVGNYITSLDMAGCSVTLLSADQELLDLYDAPVDTAGMRWGM